MLKWILSSYFLAKSLVAFAITHESFRAEARENGKVVYLEKHEVNFSDDGKALDAQTDYLSPEGKLLATLKSDFTPSLSLPNHQYEDLRTGSIYGIRRSGKKIVLFQQEKGQEEKTKELEDAQDSERLQVGCQGFNYYLKGKIESVKAQKIVPVLFMIPGELTTYKFRMKLMKDNGDGNLDFTVEIENFFMRLFAPELRFRYSQNLHRITHYEGISNIKNEKGKVMDVVIDYTY